MKILVCPLDWGLGHATRCIPLIRALVALGHQVRIGAAGGGLPLLREEFPGLEVFPFPGYRVRYSRSPGWFLPVLLAQAPRVLAGLWSESRRLRRMLADHPCDLIVSDGRYGLRTPGIPTVLITHQVFLRVPGRFPGSRLMEKGILAMNLRILRRFERVWIPDFPGMDSLSGELSHRPCGLSNLEFIRPLSRFSVGASGPDIGAQGPRDFPVADILAVVSGPEPQRTLFESALRNELVGMKGTRILVKGSPGVPDAPGAGAADRIRRDELNEFDHLPGPMLARLFADARLIVARSGYTTVMELAALGARAVVLVPTPGQSEQEYLAEHLQALDAAVRMDQHALDLASAGSRLAGRTGFARWRRRFGGPGDDCAFNLAGFLGEHPLLQGRRKTGDGSLDVQKARQQ